MKLGVAERLMLQSLLPQEGDVLTLRIVRDLQQELGFPEKEQEALGLKQEGGRVVWRTGADKGKEINIGPRAMSLIVERLEALNGQKKLTLSQLALYERFVGDTEASEETKDKPKKE